MKHAILAILFVIMSSVSFAAEPLTDEQMDKLTAGSINLVDINITILPNRGTNPRDVVQGRGGLGERNPNELGVPQIEMELTVPVRGDIDPPPTSGL